jgi:hypothetical protein
LNVEGRKNLQTNPQLLELKFLYMAQKILPSTHFQFEIIHKIRISLEKISKATWNSTWKKLTGGTTYGSTVFVD